ncbi:hypothetical protein L484_009516 [Morus notabilis]|uniref:Uncharacterized protein n=1 Tax=Morus notabilis TaxID=981085 RepID=W9REM6_9ROSA|nr:hypothetical protein L484_009516 [Morus notabilis]
MSGRSVVRQPTRGVAPSLVVTLTDGGHDFAIIVVLWRRSRSGGDRVTCVHTAVRHEGGWVATSSA